MAVRARRARGAPTVRMARLCCVSRNVTGQPPCYGAGQEPPDVETVPSSLHDRAEGRPPQAPHGRQGPVSDLCDQENLPPSVFYRWQSQLFENMAGAFATPAAANGPSKREKEQAHELAQLKARLVKKDEVIAEISAEYVTLKNVPRNERRCSVKRVGCG
jgi:hypothetical protein